MRKCDKCGKEFRTKDSHYVSEIDGKTGRIKYLRVCPACKK